MGSGVDTLWAACGHAPTHVAVEDERRRLTWADLDARTNAVGHGLEGAGLAPGDHVAVMVSNRVEFVETLLGAMRAGMVVTPVKTGWTEEEVAYLLGDAASRAIVTDRDSGRAAGKSSGVVVLDVDDAFETWVAAQDATALPGDRRGFRMSYTSGTTGRPKGVMRVGDGEVPWIEAFGRSAAMSSSVHLPLDGVHLMVSQLFHGAPLTFGLGAMAGGATLRIVSRWDPERALAQLAAGVVSTTMVPTMFRHLLTLPDEQRKGFAAPALRVVLHGGEPCPQDVKRRMIDWLGPILVEYFGFTEGAMTICTTEEWLARPGTVGRAVVKEPVILDDDGDRLAPGTEGRVFFESPDGVTFFYRNDPDKTAAAHGPGATITAGDIGWLDDDGYLFISGRVTDVIVSGGVNVYPAEIEDVLSGVPGVADACVVGGPDPDRGEGVVAFLALAPGAIAADVIAAAEATSHARLAGYKRPRRFEVVDEIPRDPTGKLLRGPLRDPLWEGRSGFAVSSGR